MKICTQCKKEKDVSEFSFRNKSKNQYSSNCKECQKIWKNKHYADNKISYYAKNKDTAKNNWKWFRELKSTYKCEECGENHPATLDFHHKDPMTKIAAVSSLVNDRFSKQKILDEIDKCTVLCSNCHRKLHWNENATVV